jgi:AraC-like DNA-binding protein
MSNFAKKSSKEVNEVYKIPTSTDVYNGKAIGKSLHVKEEIKRNYLVHSSIEELAKKAHMDSTCFKTMFTAVFDLTPYQYLLYERLKISKELRSGNSWLA